MNTKEILLELTYKCTPEVRDTAIKALEKQIPMKPKDIRTIFDYSGRYYSSEGKCPTCGAERY